MVHPIIFKIPHIYVEEYLEQLKKRKIQATTTASTSNASSTPTTKVKVKPLVKHVLSQELQLYYEKITQAIKGKNKPFYNFSLFQELTLNWPMQQFTV
jgi:hypothetical protein